MARVGVRPLVGTPVTPNHLTIMRLVTGAGAGLCFAAGETGWNWVAAAFFVLSMLLDRADGTLARLTGQTSEWGHKLDLVVDALANIVVFTGIGWGLRHSALGDWAILLGAVAGSAVAAVLFIVIRMEKLHGARAAEVRLTTAVDPDDAMILVPVLVLVGLGVPLIVAAAVGASSFALYFLWRFRRDLAASRRV